MVSDFEQMYWLFRCKCTSQMKLLSPQVWSMILAAATEGGGSQYFYLAPKMPYGLEYKPGTVS